jgi:pilus assembly protein TadC
MEERRMPTGKSNNKRKRSITEIGQVVPSNFKFGLIVAVALFWADFVRSMLNSIFSLININIPIVTDFILAIAATILGYMVLLSYRRIKSRLQKIKV